MSRRRRSGDSRALTLATAHRALHRLGFDVVRYPGRGTSLGRRARLLTHYGIDIIFDIGANVGQYAMELRDIGYQGRIVSFEPLPEAFVELSRRASRDNRWDAVNVALGDLPGAAVLHRAANLSSSSFLPMLPAHSAAAPDANYTNDVEVRVTTLDDVYDDYARPADRAFAKLDVQGFEARALRGAVKSLKRLAGLQLELSLVPLYDGASEFIDMLGDIDQRGFSLAGLEPGFMDMQSGRLLQVDAVFVRRDVAATR